MEKAKPPSNGGEKVKASSRDVENVKVLSSGGENAKLFAKTLFGAGLECRMALALFELDDMMEIYASYEELAEIIRRRFTEPQNTLKELFGRLVFNILCGNTDDHAQNHAAFWDREYLTLTPAYGICPHSRSGGEPCQAMLINGDNNLSFLKSCVNSVFQFLIQEKEAKDIIANMVQLIEESWDNVCEEAELRETDKNLFWERRFLNPFA
ncbi:MAG: serine/threonine-protein kinase HipA, partial [Lentisphaeria bacterium]